jgi:RimJ/RimL family protein N-acetyltransferase
MQNPWITPTTLEGEAVHLVPLEAAHAEPLIRAAESPETFRYFFWMPKPFTAAGLLPLIQPLIDAPNVLPFCVIDKATDSPVGMSCFLDIRPEHRALEIGSTWLAPSCRGTRFNPEMKLLMLSHAFEDRAAHRLQLKTHSENTQSRRAIEKLGAQYEGALREDILMHDASWRTSVYYSILENEWPSTQARLLKRLAGD